MITITIASYIVGSILIAGLLISAYFNEIVAWGKKIYNKLANRISKARLLLRRTGYQLKAFIEIIQGRRRVRLPDQEHPGGEILTQEVIIELFDKEPQMLKNMFSNWYELDQTYLGILQGRDFEKFKSLYPDYFTEEEIIELFDKEPQKLKNYYPNCGKLHPTYLGILQGRDFEKFKSLYPDFKEDAPFEIQRERQYQQMMQNNVVEFEIERYK